MNAVEKTEQEVGNDSAGTGSELDVLRWAVISFDRVETDSLTYADASAKMEALESAGVAGLCIVTNEAAFRISN